MHSISPQEAAQKAGLLIDVREPDEFVSGHARGAVNIPLGTVPDADLPVDGTPVYVICQSGARSARAVQALQQRGVHAINVDGGTSAWLSAGLPSAVGR